MPTPPIRVAIADDHPIVREGLRALLSRDPRVTVAAEATSFAEALQIASDTPIDVLVLDLHGMRGTPASTIARIRREHPETRVVVFSSIVDLAPEMLQAGASSYIVKEDLSDHLVSAVIAASRDGRVLSKSVTMYLQQIESVPSQQRVAPKELTVLKYLARGLSTAEIAQEMGINTNTVQNHILSVRRKTSCVERTELVDWYRRVYARENEP